MEERPPWATTSCLSQVSSRSGWLFPYRRHPCESSVKGEQRCPGRVRENAQCVMSGFLVRAGASRLVVPATGHPFAASGHGGRRRRFELVFSASPETIRREPPE
jgi:hypothetical protein